MGVLNIDLRSNLKNATTEFNDLGQVVDKTTGKIRSLGEAFKLTSEEEAELSESTKKMTAAVAGLNNEGGRMTAGGWLPKFNTSLTQSLGSTAKARVAFMDLGRVVTGQGFSLRALASNMTLFAPEAIIAVGAVALLTKAWIDHSLALTQAQKAQNALSKVLDEAKASTAGELAQLHGLLGVLTDVKSSREAQAAVMEELTQKYGKDFLKMYQDQNGAIKDQKKLTDDLTAAIFLQAQIEGLKGAITSATKKKWDELNKTTDESLTTWEKIQGVITVIGYAFDGVLADLGKVENKMAGDKKLDIAKQLDANLKDMGNALDDFEKKAHNNAAWRILFGGEGRGDGKAGSTKTRDIGKEIDEIMQKVKAAKTASEKYQDDTPIFQKIATAGQGKDSDIAKQLAARIESISMKAAKEANARVKAALKEELNAVQAYYDGVLNPDRHARHVKSISSFQLDDPAKGMQNHDTIAEKLGVGALDPLEVPYTLKPLLKKQKSLQDLKNELEDFMDKANDVINGAIEKGISSTIGDLASGKIQNIFGDLLSIIGDGLQTLGKELLGIYPIVEIARDALANAIYDPELITIAGALAIAAGAAIKGVASGGLKKFAEGGVITGPTVGLIGEAGPEVVFPLDKLKSFMGGIQPAGGAGFVASTRLSGNDMLILINRAQKNSSLRS